MHDLETLRSGGYKNDGLARLKLTCLLDSFPLEILELGQTLEHLDLSGTGLSSLPPNFGQSLPHLKIAFFSQCAFTSFPRELAFCPQLEMVAFRGNGMRTIDENALPPRLRWLILTDNKLTTLPGSIGKCMRLQKCMLAGNDLTGLPKEMQDCKKLGLLRLSSNRLAALPVWLFKMPQLAFLSFAGNPCSTSLEHLNDATNGNETGHTNETNGCSDDGATLAHIAWPDLEVHEILGEGASGIISKGLWWIDSGNSKQVAIKLFKGTLTSDGTPEDELAACIAAGQHQNIIDALGRIHNHPDEENGSFKGGLVMQLIPPHYQALGQPPSLETCTRDNYPADARLSLSIALSILGGIAAAAAHLHSRGIMHGDLYAHNILTDGSHALLGDFGAATVYRRSGGISALEGLEVLAFAHLVEDILGLLTIEEKDAYPLELLGLLHERCSCRRPASRPRFEHIITALKSISLQQRLKPSGLIS